MGKKLSLILAILCLGGIAVQSCDIGPSEITAYTALCQGTLSKGDCDGTVLPWRKIVYRISCDDQDITFMVFGSWKKPVHLKNCMIVDKHNWFGEHPDGTGREMMIRGTLVASAFCYNEYYIPWWKWWYTKLKLAITGYGTSIEKKVALLTHSPGEEE